MSCQKTSMGFDSDLMFSGAHCSVNGGCGWWNNLPADSPWLSIIMSESFPNGVSLTPINPINNFGLASESAYRVFPELLYELSPRLTFAWSPKGSSANHSQERPLSRPEEMRRDFDTLIGLNI